MLMVRRRARGRGAMVEVVGDGFDADFVAAEEPGIRKLLRVLGMHL